MNSPFKVGDRVVIVKSDLPRMVGVVCRITSELFASGPPRCNTDWALGTIVHALDVPSAINPSYIVAYPPEYLRPYTDDDREPIAWTDELERLCRGRVKA